MAIKLGLHSLPPFLAAGVRFFLAFLFLFIFIKVKRMPLPLDLKSHLYFLWFGFLNFTGGYALVYWGQQYIESGLASVLFSVMPFYMLLLSIKFLPEDVINIKKTIGVIIGFIGILVIFWDQISFQAREPQVIYGMIGVLISPLFSALGTISGKKSVQKMPAIILVTFPMLYASANFLILSLLFERGMHPVFDHLAIFSLLYLSLFGTSVAFAIYFWMLKNTSAVLMSMITYVTPPLALFWGWFVLAEHISLHLLAGLMLVLTGIIFVRK